MLTPKGSWKPWRDVTFLKIVLLYFQIIKISLRIINDLEIQGASRPSF